MKTRVATSLPKDIVKLLTLKPSAKKEFIRIEWDDSMVLEGYGKFFRAVYLHNIASRYSQARTVETSNDVIIRGWCPHEKYGT